MSRRNPVDELGSIPHAITLSQPLTGFSLFTPGPGSPGPDTVVWYCYEVRGRTGCVMSLEPFKTPSVGSHPHSWGERVQIPTMTDTYRTYSPTVTQ